VPLTKLDLAKKRDYTHLSTKVYNPLLLNLIQIQGFWKKSINQIWSMDRETICTKISQTHVGY